MCERLLPLKSWGISQVFMELVLSAAETAMALMHVENMTKMLMRCSDASFIFHDAAEGCTEET